MSEIRSKSILYLDLDGTVRYSKHGEFVNKPEDIAIYDDVIPKIRCFKKAGYRILGITNQGGVALGHLTFSDLKKNIIRTQELCGGLFDKILACTHHPDSHEKEFKYCWCRKPKTGLIVEGALGLSEIHKGEYYPAYMSLFVGDRPEDKQCAENADIPFMEAKKFRELKKIEFENGIFKEVAA